MKHSFLSVLVAPYRGHRHRLRFRLRWCDHILNGHSIVFYRFVLIFLRHHHRLHILIFRLGYGRQCLILLPCRFQKLCILLVRLVTERFILLPSLPLELFITLRNSSVWALTVVHVYADRKIRINRFIVCFLF